MQKGLTQVRAHQVLRVDRDLAENSAPAMRVLAVASLGYLLASWAMNPVSSILPTIAGDLELDPTRAGWIMNAYFLLLVGWVLIAGRLGDAFGHGAVFRAGCGIFATGSLLAFAATGLELLVLGRAIQGLGSAMVFGTTLALVAAAYPGRQLGWAIGVLTMSSGVSGIVGVWVSTQLAEHFGWHVTFLVPVGLGLLTALASRGLPSVRRISASVLDWWGGVLLFGALTFMLLGLNHLHEGPETFEGGAPYHLSMHAVALTLLVAFLWRQAHTPRPLISLRLFSNRRLTTGVVANGIAHSSMLATSLLIPFLLERGRGYSPNETAELLMAMQIFLIAGAYGGGWLYSRANTPAIGVVALGSMAVGLLLMGDIGADLPFVALFPVVGVLGAGLGCFTAVNNTAVMGCVGSDQRGFASGLVETTRQLGHSLGVSLSSGVLATSVAAASVPSLGYRSGFSEAAMLMGLVSTTGVLIVLYPALRSLRLPVRLGL